MAEQMNLPLARAARDAGLLAVTDANVTWLAKALVLLALMRQEHAEATGEMMRAWLLKRGLEQPSSSHAWGALVRCAMTRGVIADTGRVMSMATVKSHARRTPVWRFTQGAS